MKDWQYTHLFIKRSDVVAMFSFCVAQYYSKNAIRAAHATVATDVFAQYWPASVRSVFVTEEQLCLALGKTFQLYDFPALLEELAGQVNLTDHLSRNMSRMLWKDACAQVRIDEYHSQPRPLWERFLDWLH